MDCSDRRRSLLFLARKALVPKTAIALGPVTHPDGLKIVIAIDARLVFLLFFLIKELRTLWSQKCR